MKKTIKKVSCMLAALVILFSCMPLSVFAVDPVSASVMANAFAQAIAAYGASNGVSMTFDVANTNGIGEGVHDLWSRFRAGQQTSDDFETIAAAIWPDLYQKVLMGESAVVGLSVAAEYVQEMDEFWNWVLSGPAEMTRVDNEYYQFNQSQIGTGAVPLPVNTITIPSISNVPLGVSRSLTYTNGSSPQTISSSSDLYYYLAYRYYGNDYWQTVLVVFPSAGNDQVYYYNGTATNFSSAQTYGPVYYRTTSLYMTEQYLTPWEPRYSYSSNAITDVLGQAPDDAAINTVNDTIGVKAYGRDGIADIPDNTDVNYQPLPYVGGLDIPWDDTLFGDGTGTLTDAQSEAATDAIDGAIVRDRELILAGDTTSDTPGDDTDDPPSTDPDDYQLPGLADLFPFCIPFDIYHFLQALAATPVAPSFTCTLQLPAAIGGARTIELDFDTPTFNQIAQLLRLLELLAFIVGLALLTRSMFIRG